MTKEEKIQEVYGLNYEIAKTFINKNGWFDTSGTSEEMKCVYEFVKSKPYEQMKTRENGLKFFIRPISLKGIENNNGWIKIESEDDLPIYGYYEVIERKTGNQSRATLDNDFGVKINLKTYSHYQKIKEIPNPIY